MSLDEPVQKGISQNYIDSLIDDTRKETAKEILQTLYDKCFELDARKRILGSFTCYVAPYDILELAKQYGVEVEE